MPVHAGDSSDSKQFDILLAMVGLLLLLASFAAGAERQITSSPISKALDNNDNFSPDGKYVVYDTRDTDGVGLGASTRIMKVELASGKESVVYRPEAPGVAAVSWSPIANEVLFIHGPLISEIERLGPYAQTNRRGAVVAADGSGKVRFVDCRDVSSAVTPAGAHRGGTHRHDYSADGKRIGFTYDDHLLRTYGRNIGMLIPRGDAPCGVSHYFAVLLKVVPRADAKAGDFVRAEDDSWIGAKGLMRGFIGTVSDGKGGASTSLFVVDVPESVDFTTAQAGTASQYPQPPKGLTVRVLARKVSPGVVRGSLDGTRVAYYAPDANGVRQVFLINARGTSEPVQATFLPAGATAGLRWHPSGDSIAVLSENGVAVTCVKPGPLFGKTVWLTQHGAAAAPAEGLVWSPDGKRLAFNRRIAGPTKDAAGKDFRQVFLTDFPDKNNNGIADDIETGSH